MQERQWLEATAVVTVGLADTVLCLGPAWLCRPALSLAVLGSGAESGTARGRTGTRDVSEGSAPATPGNALNHALAVEGVRRKPALLPGVWHRAGLVDDPPPPSKDR